MGFRIAENSLYLQSLRYMCEVFFFSESMRRSVVMPSTLLDNLQGQSLPGMLWLISSRVCGEDTHYLIKFGIGQPVLQ